MIPVDDVLTKPAEAMLHYLSDFSSPLPFPLRFAASDSRQRTNDLKAWLSTATFKRIPLSDILDESKEIYRYMPEFSMTISGIAKDQAQRPLKNGRLVAFDAWSAMPFDSEVHHNGTFSVETADFSDGTEFFLQWLNKKDKPENARIELADATFPAVAIERQADAAAYYTDYGATAGITENVHHLGDIVVRAPVVKQNRFEEKVFYGHRAKDREKIEERGYLTLLDILQDLPTLTVAKATKDDPDGGSESGPRREPSVDAIIAKAQKDSGTRWVIKTHRGASTLAKAGAYVPLFIDGILYEPEMYDLVFGMPALDVESVEYLTPAESLVFTSSCLNGVVSVKTRNSNFASRKKVEAKGVLVKPSGLSIVPDRTGPMTAPTKPGDYLLQVDVITPSSITSSARPVKVQ